MYCCAKVRTHHCKVILLDDQEITLEIKSTSLGQELLDSVYRHLNLLETSYFGLRFKDKDNQTQWLDCTLRVVRQLKGSCNFIVYFGVKFYAADPCKLHDEITRYQFFLQLKQDVLQGRLPVSLSLAAELGAYAVQSELGDFDDRRHSAGYVSEFRFVSNQTAQLEEKIEELHKELTGYLPAMAELQYLEKVKWLEMYGVDLHPVLGEDNVEYFLGLTPTGIILLRNKNKVASYTWSSIVKMMHKRKYFMLKVEDKNMEQNTYGFETPSKSACKHLYKCCIEQNAFFRLANVAPDPTMVSDQRDRTQDIKLKLRSEPDIIRSSSNRHQRRMASFNVNNSHSNLSITKDNKFYKKNSPYSVTPVRPLAGGWSSPRSVRSAPPLRGLFTSSSPRSVHSSRTRRTPTNRSASVDSHSSEESRSFSKQRSHRRQNSDNESEGSAKSRRRRNRSRRLSASGRSHSSRYERKERSKQLTECASDGQSVISTDVDFQINRKIRESDRESRPRERQAEPNTKYKPFIRYVENEDSLSGAPRSNQKSDKSTDHRSNKGDSSGNHRSRPPRDGKSSYNKHSSSQHSSRHKHKRSQGSTSDLLKKKDTNKKKPPHEMSTEL